MPIDRWPRDAELGSDLDDGVAALAVGPGFVVHGLRELHLTRAELGLRAAAPAAGASGREAVEGALVDEDVLEFGDGAAADDARGSCRVRAVAERDVLLTKPEPVPQDRQAVKGRVPLSMIERFEEALASSNMTNDQALEEALGAWLDARG